MKVGDWVLFRDDSGFTKETATDLEEVEGDYIVHYIMETFDLNGRLQNKEEVARFRTGELAEYAEIVRARAKVDRRTMNIAGQDVMVYIASMPEDPPYEMWYSDDIGITGNAGMKYTLPTGSNGEMEDYYPIEVMAFGTERDKLDIRRYVRIAQDRERERARKEKEQEEALRREVEESNKR